MEIKNIQKKDRKNIPLSIRTYKEYSEFMTKQNISPTAFFNESLKELMEKQAKNKPKSK